MDYNINDGEEEAWSVHEFSSEYQRKPPRSFEDLWIWQQAREMVRMVYADFAEGQPGHKDGSFRDHIQKTSVSIKNNIAEGFERATNPEFARFLEIAKGSAGELRSMYYTAEDLDYVSSGTAEERKQKVKRISAGISSLIDYLRERH
jgi:four helix bundle protein